MSYPISASLLPHLAGSSGARGAPSDSAFRDTFHSVNDAAFISRVIADSGFGFVYHIQKRFRPFWQTSTRMNCVTVPEMTATSCPGFWTKYCVLLAYRVNHETNATRERPIRLFSSWNNLAEGTAVKVGAYV